MAVRPATGGKVLTLDTLVRLRRGLHTPAAPRRLPVPDGMTTPWAATRWRYPPASARS